MTAELISFVSAGDDLRFWQKHDQASLLRLDCCLGNIACLDWSENGFHLAVCSQEKQPVTIVNISQDLKSTPAINSSTLTQVAGNATTASFSHESHFCHVGVGYDDGKIAIVNARSLEIIKTFSSDRKDGIISLSFDSSSTRLATSQENGELLVYNVAQGIHGKPLIQSDEAIVRQVKFSPHKKSVLASGSDSGSVTMWDAFKSAKSHCFSQTHTMPVTGLAFSPLNDMLLLSAGLDKQFCALDLRKNQVVKTINTDGPLSSMDFHWEGWAVGVGTTRGRVLIYDLRHSSRPVSEIAAHQTSVQGLKFATKSSGLTSAHFPSTQVATSPLLQKTNKPTTAISPLSASENISRAASSKLSNDPLASFYMRPNSAMKPDTELGHKSRILEAQRLLNQTPVIPSLNYDNTENIYRSHSVDAMSIARTKNDETFRSTTATDVRNLSPITTRESNNHPSRFEAGILIPQNRPLPSAASTPFHAIIPKRSHLNTTSTISTLPSRLPIDTSRSDSVASFASAISHTNSAFPSGTAEDSWSPSPEPLSGNATLKGNVANVETQTDIVGKALLSSHSDVGIQTECPGSENAMNLLSLIDERFDPIEENIKRLNARFVSMMFDQTSDLRHLLQEQLSPNVQLQSEVDRLKVENAQLREKLVSFEDKLFNSTLRL